MNDCQPERDACGNCAVCSPYPQDVVTSLGPVPPSIPTRTIRGCEGCGHETGGVLCSLCQRRENTYHRELTEDFNSRDD